MSPPDGPPFDPGRRWISRAACAAPGMEDLFHPDAAGRPRARPTRAVQQRWDAAKAVCAGCPVLAACRRDTLGEREGVWGGLDPHERWRGRARFNAGLPAWPAARRREAGRVVHALRKKGLAWGEIQRLTALSGSNAQALERGYESATAPPGPAAPRAPGKTPATAPGPRRVFPGAPAPRDAWVRYADLVLSADYMAQTPDGAWFYLRVRGAQGARQTTRWFPARDVRLDRPPHTPAYKERRKTDGKRVPERRQSA